MSDELNQSDYQAVVDLDNLLSIFNFERQKGDGSLTEEPFIFIESLLDQYGPVFLKQKDDLKNFAQSAKDVLTELLAHQPFSHFVGVAVESDSSQEAYRKLDAQEFKQGIEYTRGLANKIVNHFELLEEKNQNKASQNPEKVDKKNEKR